MTSKTPASPTPAFDPDAAATPGSGIFGLPFTRENSRVVLVPVPFDATTSYARGTADGPDAIMDASLQVDLYDRRFGRVYEKGIVLLDEEPRIRELSEKAGALSTPIVERGGATEADAKDIAQINKASEEMNSWVEKTARSIHDEGKIPGIVGGEHSVPFGAIKAAAEKHKEIGILHVDAHMDFRDAFEGFAWSHASIMHNVISRIPGVKRLVQVGIRDFGEREMEFAREHADRIHVHYDDVWAEEMLSGATFTSLCKKAIEPLPHNVYVSFDIDALDPSLCPHTGTPVPGGLSFNQAVILLDTLKNSGRAVIGFDLVEVAPGPEDEPELDANVGARLLYKLCGLV